MHPFSALRRMKIHTPHGVAGTILIILFLGSFIAPRYTEAQTGKPAISENKVEGSLTEIGKNYIIVNGKKYTVSKDLKIKDLKGNYTSSSLERLRVVDRIRIILEDNMVTEIQILSYTS
jgi:hypothetical protein